MTPTLADALNALWSNGYINFRSYASTPFLKVLKEFGIESVSYDSAAHKFVDIPPTPASSRSEDVPNITVFACKHCGCDVELATGFGCDVCKPEAAKLFSDVQLKLTKAALDDANERLAAALAEIEKRKACAERLAALNRILRWAEAFVRDESRETLAAISAELTKLEPTQP